MDERPRLTVRAFQPDDLRRIAPNEPGIDESLDLSGVVGDAWTVLDDGAPVAAGGLIPVHDYRGIAWAFVSRAAPPLRLLRLAREYLDRSQFDRVEAAVAEGYEPGHRWAKLLGFCAEGPPARCYLPNGGTAQLYVRLAHDRP